MGEGGLGVGGWGLRGGRREDRDETEEGANKWKNLLLYIEENEGIFDIINILNHSTISLFSMIFKRE